MRGRGFVQALDLQCRGAGGFKDQPIPAPRDFGDLLIGQPGKNTGLCEVDVQNDQTIEVPGCDIAGCLPCELQVLLVHRHDIQGIFVGLLGELADEIA